MIKVSKCPIEGLLVIEPEVHRDSRGYFVESYNKRDLRDLGIDREFVQDNRSSSHRGVLRGLHFQIKHPQAKLVSVTEGSVFDVAVDLRKDSKTFLSWFAVELSGENFKEFFIPEGFAHGFLVLSDTAVFSYKCSDYYTPGDEGGIIWNDPKIGIEWPDISLKEGTLYRYLEYPLEMSEKDLRWPSVANSDYLCE